MFSILAPGKTIPQHRGPYNGVLRLHVGLRVLTSEPHICAIRVNGETRTWANDEVLLFDDSYQHDAWNLNRSVPCSAVRVLHAPTAVARTLAEHADDQADCEDAVR